MAASLVEGLKEEFEFEESLIRSSGGVFEVKVDGDLIFSKKAEDRFPETDEIIDLIYDRM